MQDLFAILTLAELLECIGEREAQTEVVWKALDGGLKHFDLRWSDETALTVVMAANGYPDAYEKGSEIKNLDSAGKVGGVKVFHAGTKLGLDGRRVLANGGRVLNVTAMAPTVEQAR